MYQSLFGTDTGTDTEQCWILGRLAYHRFRRFAQQKSRTLVDYFFHDEVHVRVLNPQLSKVATGPIAAC